MSKKEKSNRTCAPVWKSQQERVKRKEKVKRVKRKRRRLMTQLPVGKLILRL